MKYSIRYISGALALITGILAMSVFLSACSPGDNSGRKETIAVAWSPFEHTALFYVAEDRGFFSKNGLEIDSRMYNSGAQALAGVLAGEAEVVVGVTEFPMVGQVFQQQNVSIVASMAESNMIYLVARRDRGIREPSDLKGKRVGTTVGTIAEFYLGRFLELNGMDMHDIDLVDLRQPEEWVNAVVNGDIDAISTAQPYAYSAEKGLGTNAVSWQVQSGQPMYALVVATDEWIASHPGLAERFLRSLSQAEIYANSNPGATNSTIQKNIDADDAYMGRVLSQNQYELSLVQPLILAMEDEARWMISNNLTAGTRVPNFLDYIYTDGLKSVRPDAVRIAGK